MESEEISEPIKGKKPSDSAFKQQKLSAWQPILTAGTVLPTFFVIGILFIPVGIGLWYFSDNVHEVIIPYTDCLAINNPIETCAKIIDDNPEANCSCRVNFNFTTDLSGKVYMYYALTNFYQNHRRYVKSRDDNQLFGQIGSAGAPERPAADCRPFDEMNGKFVLPCGAIANSMFTDEINLFYNDDKLKVSDTQVSLIRKGIAWESDKQFKFKNPRQFENRSDDIWKHFTKPRNWRKELWELDPDNKDNNGLENEDFIVWMRTAALPNFRKLYRIVDPKNPSFQKGMPAGSYYLIINYSYPVKRFQGTKSIVFSSTSLLGGKNPFLGVSYIVVGTICLFLGILFLFIHINYGKSTWEMTNVDTRTPY